MKRNFWLKKLPIAFTICALVITAASWQNQPANTKQTFIDTPRKKIKDIDEALLQLEKSRAELEKTLKNKDWEKDIKESMKDFDADKIKEEIENAMKEIDVAKIQADVQKAMKEVDMEKIKAEMQKALTEIDAEKIKAEISKAMKEIDVAKIKADVDASLAKIDMEKIKAEIDRVKEIDFKKMEEELKNIGPEIEKSMAAARESIEKAKKELTEYKSFINSLEKDGFINKDNYTIEYKNGELTINGKKQAADVIKKYHSFLKDRKDFTIKKNDDDFNIEND
jgi:DNA repair exonuclease SbcCD ATPase subunit